MALWFPWATKEYILREMSLGQLIMYHNLAVEEKYPDPEKKKHKKHSDYANALKEMTNTGLIDRDDLKRQYGDIDG